MLEILAKELLETKSEMLRNVHRVDRLIRCVDELRKTRKWSEFDYDKKKSLKAYLKEPPFSRFRKLFPRRDTRIAYAIQLVWRVGRFDIQPHDIAKNFHIGVPHLRKLFQAEIGESLSHVKSQLILQRAKSLLEAGTNVSVKEIADQCGFSDTYHFSRWFSKKAGRPATIYRERLLFRRSKNSKETS